MTPRVGWCYTFNATAHLATSAVNSDTLQPHVHNLHQPLLAWILITSVVCAVQSRQQNIEWTSAENHNRHKSAGYTQYSITTHHGPENKKNRFLLWRFKIFWLVGWLEFNVPFQHKYRYQSTNIRDCLQSTLHCVSCEQCQHNAVHRLVFTQVVVSVHQ